MNLDEWSAAAVDASTGASPPAAEEWTAVSVPGRHAQFAGADTVAYRTRFSDPRTGDDTRAFLQLSGLYGHARIWLNGDLLGTHDTYFVPARFLFDPRPENELIVECRRPDDRFGGVYETDLVPEEVRVPGIWWGATLDGVPPVAMLDFAVDPVITADGAVFETTVTVDAERDVDDSITFSIRPEGFRGGGTMRRARVAATAGERTTVERDIEIDDPQYWYPQGSGPQHRYVLTARFKNAEISRSTGFRSVEHDEDGLLVNGRRVRARGFNVLPGDSPVVDVKRAAEANANLVRAHAHVPSHEFHAACDEAGLLVFQDLPLSGPGGYDIGRAKSLAEQLVANYRHHPSVSMYGVHDDPRELFPEPVGGGRLGRWKVRWRVWRDGGYDASADESVADVYPEDALVYPVCGGLNTTPDGANIYPGWDFGTPREADWLLGRNPMLGEVVTEFGAGSLAGEGAAGVEIAGFDRRKHDAHVEGGVEDSQSYQARVVKTVAESLRRHGYHAMAAFALRDADEGAGMGVLTRGDEEKEAFAALAESYQPVQVALAAPPKPGTVETTVVNDSTQDIEGTVTWQAGAEEESEEISVEAFDTAPGPAVAIPDNAEVVKLTLAANGGQVVNHYRL